jgi:hypothetical protein
MSLNAILRAAIEKEMQARMIDIVAYVPDWSWTGTPHVVLVTFFATMTNVNLVSWRAVISTSYQALLSWCSCPGCMPTPAAPEERFRRCMLASGQMRRIV